MNDRSHKIGGCRGINPYLLYSSFLIFPPQVIDIYNQSAFILAYHVTNFAMINPLVLLKAKYSQLIKLCDQKLYKKICKLFIISHFQEL